MNEKPQVMKITTNKDFRCLLRARATLIWIVSAEERRVEQIVKASAMREGYSVRFWDCATGATDEDGKKFPIGGGEIPDTNPHAVFEKIRDKSESAVWVMRDLDALLNDVQVVRALKSLARDLQEEMDRSKLTTIVLLSPAGEVPLALRGSAVMMDWPLPTRAEIGEILDDVQGAAGLKDAGKRDEIIDAAAGLAADDIAGAFALSFVHHKRIDPGEVTHAKKQVIKREKLLTWHEPDPRGMDALGGLDLLKPWLMERRLAFSPEARAYGLPPAKGVLLVGPSGTGKSATAKCTATAFGVPLLRMDLGALKGSHVGQSEDNIRRALKTVEAVTRCVLWLDEVEKALAGAHGAGGDSGVSADQLGTLLFWIQETTLPVFLIATSNDPLLLKPEFISRFDDTFFVDLPTTRERAEILAKSVAFYGRKPEKFDLKLVAEATPGFSGRELDKLVKAALFRAFADRKREVVTEDLAAIVSGPGAMVPVSKSQADTVAGLRKWADGRARWASEKETETVSAAGSFGRLLTVNAGGDDDE